MDRLTNDPKADYAPAWSPDGKRIAFANSSGPREVNSEIYTMNANGTGLDKVTSDPKQDIGPNWQRLPRSQK